MTNDPTDPNSGGETVAGWPSEDEIMDAARAAPIGTRMQYRSLCTLGYRAGLATAEQRIRELEGERDNWYEQYRFMEGLRDDHCRQQCEAERQVSTLTTERDKLIKEAWSIGTELEEAQQRIVELTAERDHERRERNSAQAVVMLVYQQLNGELAGGIDEIAGSLHGGIDRLKRERDEASIEMDRYREKKRDGDQRIASLIDDVQQLSGTLRGIVDDLDNSSKIAPFCSVEFHCEARAEVKLFVEKLRAETEKLRQLWSGAAEERDSLSDRFAFERQDHDVTRGYRLLAEQDRTTLTTELDKATALLHSLLARIHGDGGQHTIEHGIAKACADADAVVVRVTGERDDAIARVASLEQCQLLWDTQEADHAQSRREMVARVKALHEETIGYRSAIGEALAFLGGDNPRALKLDHADTLAVMLRSALDRSAKSGSEGSGETNG